MENLNKEFMMIISSKRAKYLAIKRLCHHKRSTIYQLNRFDDPEYNYKKVVRQCVFGMKNDSEPKKAKLYNILYSRQDPSKSLLDHYYNIVDIRNYKELCSWIDENVPGFIKSYGKINKNQAKKIIYDYFFNN